MKAHLQTRRLNLRPVTLEDAANVARLAGNPAIARMTGRIALPYFPLAAEFWIMTSAIDISRGRLHLYGLSLRDDLSLQDSMNSQDDGQSTHHAHHAHAHHAHAHDPHGLIGTIAIFPRPDANWELGYWLGEPYWRQGLMREAISAVMSEADAHLDTSDLHASVYHDNPRSLGLLKSFGFEAAGNPAPAFCMARDHSVALIQMKRNHDRLKASS